MQYFKKTIYWLSLTFLLKEATYCCFPGFEYLTGFLKVTLLFLALTLQRAWFDLLQKRVCPLLDFQDLVCIFVAVKYWKQKCESTSSEESWLKTGSDASSRTLLSQKQPLSSTELALENMACRCHAAEASPSLCCDAQLAGLTGTMSRQPPRPCTVCKPLLEESKSLNGTNSSHSLSLTGSKEHTCSNWKRVKST